MWLSRFDIRDHRNLTWLVHHEDEAEVRHATSDRHHSFGDLELKPIGHLKHDSAETQPRVIR